MKGGVSLRPASINNPSKLEYLFWPVEKMILSDKHSKIPTTFLAGKIICDILAPRSSKQKSNIILHPTNYALGSKLSSIEIQEGASQPSLYAGKYLFHTVQKSPTIRYNKPPLSKPWRRYWTHPTMQTTQCVNHRCGELKTFQLSWKYWYENNGFLKLPWDCCEH